MLMTSMVNFYETNLETLISSNGIISIFYLAINLINLWAHFKWNSASISNF